MNIIQRRIEKALALNYRTSLYNQARLENARRRGSYRKGEVRLLKPIGIRLTAEQFARLDRLCHQLNVEKAVIVRDAVDFYLHIAESEMEENPVVPTTVRRSRK